MFQYLQCLTILNTIEYNQIPVTTYAMTLKFGDF